MPTVASTYFSVKNSDPTNNTVIVQNTDGTTALGIGTNTPAYSLDIPNGTARIATLSTPSLSGYALRTAPAPWTDGGSGLTYGWTGTTATITGAAAPQGRGGIYNLLTITALSGTASIAMATEWNELVVDTSTNLTNKVRASFANATVQSSAGTITKVEVNTGLMSIAAGSAGTLSGGYGTSGEIISYSDSLTITNGNGLFGTFQLHGNGNVGTGYAVNADLVDDDDGIGATGTFTTQCAGVFSTVTHNAPSAMATAYGTTGLIFQNSSAAITTGAGIYANITFGTGGSGAVTNAYGVLSTTTFNSSGGATDGPVTTHVAFRSQLAMNGTGATGSLIATSYGVEVLSPTFGTSSTGTITTRYGMKIFTQLNGLTAATLAGGYTAIGAELQVGSQGGNTSGTNTNYGLRITGDGGTAGAGGTVTNYAINSSSAAPSVIAGPLGIGNSTPSLAIVFKVLGSSAVTSQAGAVWNAISFAASTATISGSTNITTAAGANFFTIAAPTLSAASALTVTNSATLAVAGAPTGGGAGPATVTNMYAIWSQAGINRFDGDVLTIGTATSMTDGFLYIPGGAGAPTGAPTKAGLASIALYYDTTNHFLYVRENATWKKSTVYA